ncbi:MAG: NADH-ubiquinone oxidoreductase chain H, partial [uncultured Thermomicrobiales bacterium]
ERPTALADLHRRVHRDERAARRHGLHDLVRAEGPRPDAGPPRPDPHRAGRAPPADRRRDQAPGQGGPDPRRRRQAGLLLRAAGHLRDRDRLRRRDPLRRHGRDLRPRRQPLRGGPQRRGALHPRLRLARGLRDHPRLLRLRQPLPPPRRAARRRPGHLLRDRARARPRRRLHPLRVAQPARHPRPAAGDPEPRPDRHPELVHPLAADRLRDLHHRRRRRDQPRAVRPARGRDRTRRRVPHRVLRLPLLLLLPGRVHQHDRDLALREHALPRRHRRPGLGSLLGSRHLLAACQDHRLPVLLHLAPGHPAALPLRPADGHRLEGAAAAGAAQHRLHCLHPARRQRRAGDPRLGLDRGRRRGGRPPRPQPAAGRWRRGGPGPDLRRGRRL